MPKVRKDEEVIGYKIGGNTDLFNQKKNFNFE
jgi:hypothetical protein